MKGEEASRGRGGSMRMFAATRRLYVGYAIVSGGFAIAVGLTLADEMQNLPRVTACFLATARWARESSTNR